LDERDELNERDEAEEVREGVLDRGVEMARTRTEMRASSRSS
jgi:hypothetical protein